MCMGRKRVIEIDGELVFRNRAGRCDGESDGFLMGDVGRRDGLTLFLESAYPFWGGASTVARQEWTEAPGEASPGTSCLNSITLCSDTPRF